MKNQFTVIWITLSSITLMAQKQGIATHFEELGTPFGGCGVPTELVESEHFVALNVFNRPNTQGQSDFTRPLKGADTVLMGEFQNGKNCGRWVKVSILDDCKGGSNSGILGETPCKGVWTADKFNKAELFMVITDACGDNNAWCREIQKHLDLHTSSLNQFEIEGEKVGTMYPLAFNNRKIEWEYVDAPNYQGDIKIHFMQNSQRYWGAIVITNLPNGIHGVEQKINNQWVKLDMNSDMGQSYLLKSYNSPITVRVYDADDDLLNNGREYQFDNICFDKTCTKPATEVIYEKTDCFGEMGGKAFIDSCGTCAGGKTGIEPILNKNSCITEVQNKDVKMTLEIFPNPVKDIIKLKNISGVVQYQIVDLKGSVLSSGWTVKEIELSSLETGFYHISLMAGNSVINQMFFKE